jgi:quercetin dioxygenase-like cupin family protein
MKVFDIKDMKGGWFIGDFSPSVFKNPFFEVAHHTHEAGYVTPRHTHKIAQELTYIVRGKMSVSGRELSSGSMFIYEPNEVAEVLILEDVDLIVVKWPSVPSDKYMVE